MEKAWNEFIVADRDIAVMADVVSDTLIRFEIDDVSYRLDASGGDSGLITLSSPQESRTKVESYVS